MSVEIFPGSSLRSRRIQRQLIQCLLNDVDADEFAPCRQQLPCDRSDRAVADRQSVEFRRRHDAVWGAREEHFVRRIQIVGLQVPLASWNAELIGQFQNRFAANAGETGSRRRFQCAVRDEEYVSPLVLGEIAVNVEQDALCLRIDEFGSRTRRFLCATVGDPLPPLVPP